MVILVIVVIAYKLVKRTTMSDKCKKVFRKLRRLVLWNPVIRYYLLNFLKFNLTGMVVLAGLRKGDGEIPVAILLLLVVNAVPIALTSWLMRNRIKLQKKKTKKKCGTLYNGLDIQFRQTKTGKFLKMPHRRTLL